MADIDVDELEVEEKQSDGIRIHQLKSLLVGFIRTIETEFVNDIKNNNIPVPFRDICQLSYLFYWGLYPTLFILNGSGEDGDEYHNNGVLVINITDGRFNHLNIYDALHPQTLVTMPQNDEENYWDKQLCGVCIVESIPLPKTLLNDIHNDEHKLFDEYTSYHCIFRCGGETVTTLAPSRECSVIIYRNNSKLITKVDNRIIKRLDDFSNDQDVIVDSFNAYQVQLPRIPYALSDNKITSTKCTCLWSDTLGLIAIFQDYSVCHFDWHHTFEWKLLSAKSTEHQPNIRSGLPLASLIHNNHGEECLFMTINYVIGIYMLSERKWKPVAPVRNITSMIVIDDSWMKYKCPDICYDSRRNRVYLRAMKQKENVIICYDINGDKWFHDIFPPYPENDGNLFDHINLLFMDKLHKDRLFVCVGRIYGIDLEDVQQWELCGNMSFMEPLELSPMHVESTMERLLSST